MDNVENELHNESMSLQRANLFWLLGDEVIVQKVVVLLEKSFFKDASEKNVTKLLKWKS